MAELLWDQVGDRLYESGVNRGVLFVDTNPGVVWNGLVTVTESPSGAEASPQYADNRKYLNLVSTEELGGTIEAFTAPRAFGVCDGTLSPFAGLSLGQQRRKLFGMSYRTNIGNDVDGLDHGYKIHFIYNALAAPSERAYGTVNDSPEAITLSWEFSTTPVYVSRSLKPSAHVSIDSTKVSKAAIKELEDILYGRNGETSRLPLPPEIIQICDDLADAPDPDPTPDPGGGSGSRTPVTEDSSDPGVFNAASNVLPEDSSDPGTFLISGSGLTEDPNDPGTYLIGNPS